MKPQLKNSDRHKHFRHNSVSSEVDVSNTAFNMARTDLLGVFRTQSDSLKADRKRRKDEVPLLLSAGRQCGSGRHLGALVRPSQTRVDAIPTPKLICGEIPILVQLPAPKLASLCVVAA
jgi:hypothetical protein